MLNRIDYIGFGASQEKAGFKNSALIFLFLISTIINLYPLRAS